jgi:hypothetical protein
MDWEICLNPDTWKAEICTYIYTIYIHVRVWKRVLDPLYTGWTKADGIWEKSTEENLSQLEKRKDELQDFYIYKKGRGGP